MKSATEEATRYAAKSNAFKELLRLLEALPEEDREAVLKAAMVFYDIRA